MIEWIIARFGRSVVVSLVRSVTYGELKRAKTSRSSMVVRWHRREMPSNVLVMSKVFSILCQPRHIDKRFEMCYDGFVRLIGVSYLSV